MCRIPQNQKSLARAGLARMKYKLKNFNLITNRDHFVLAQRHMIARYTCHVTGEEPGGANKKTIIMRRCGDMTYWERLSSYGPWVPPCKAMPTSGRIVGNVRECYKPGQDWQQGITIFTITDGICTIYPVAFHGRFAQYSKEQFEVKSWYREPSQRLTTVGFSLAAKRLVYIAKCNCQQTLT